MKNAVLSAKARKVLLLAALTACIMAISGTAALAGGEAVEVDSGQLLESADEYDGREVIYEGEAIGDVMMRGDFAWLTVNDDHYSEHALHEAGELKGGNSGIGVWLPADEAEKVNVLGRYGTVGDYVRVRGTFNADCAEHGGDVDIHAVSLEVIKPGLDVDTGPGLARYLAAGLAFVFLAVSMMPYFRRRAREMRSARSLMKEEK